MHEQRSKIERKKRKNSSKFINRSSVSLQRTLNQIPKDFAINQFLVMIVMEALSSFRQSVKQNLHQRCTINSINPCEFP